MKNLFLIVMLNACPLVSCDKCVDMINVEVYRAEKAFALCHEAYTNGQLSLFEYGYLKGCLVGMKISKAIAESSPSD